SSRRRGTGLATPCTSARATATACRRRTNGFLRERLSAGGQVELRPEGHVAAAVEPSLRCQRIALVAPVADAAVHGDHVGVAHLLQLVRRQRRAEAAAAVE